MQRDDFAQRHLGAIRRAQEKIEQRGAVSALARIAHLDLDFLVAARDALGADAVERVSHLQPHALRGEAERMAARRDFEQQVLIAVGRSSSTVVTPRKRPNRFSTSLAAALRSSAGPPRSRMSMSRPGGPPLRATRLTCSTLGSCRSSSRQASMNSSVRTGRSSEGASSTVKPPYRRR